MIQRTITSGRVTSIDGTPLAGVKVTFLLVDAASKKASDAWDVTSGERIAGGFMVVTNAQARLADADGNPILQLWPNDCGNPATMYRVSVDYPGFRVFYAAVPSGDSDLDWMDLYSMGVALEPATLPLIQQLLDRVAALEASVTPAGSITNDDGTNIAYDDGSPMIGG